MIWNVLLSLVAGYLLIVSFGSNNTKSTKKNNTDATDSSGSKHFKIAYFEMDSVAANFELVKEVKTELSKKEQDYFDLRTRKETDIKTKIEEFCKEFNTDYDYNYIVSYEQGLFFYKDTAYNITKELIRGLNEKYKSFKKD